jgi:peptide deformylase
VPQPAQTRVRDRIVSAAKAEFSQHGIAGARIDRIAKGFHARVVQHECDHLDGVLYPMRVKDFTRFGYTSVLFPELDPNSDDD